MTVPLALIWTRGLSSASPVMRIQFTFVLFPELVIVRLPSVTVTVALPVVKGTLPLGSNPSTTSTPSTATPWTESRYPASPTETSTKYVPLVRSYSQVPFVYVGGVALSMHAKDLR